MMYAPTSFVIRDATPDDESAIRRLAALDSVRPITGPALIGEIAGRPAAAISLVDGRVAADPFQPTAVLLIHLRLRVRSLRAHARTPSLAERLRVALTPAMRPPHPRAEVI